MNNACVKKQMCLQDLPTSPFLFLVSALLLGRSTAPPISGTPHASQFQTQGHMSRPNLFLPILLSAIKLREYLAWLSLVPG